MRTPSPQPASTTPQYNTYQLSGIVLKLREGLNISIREHGGSPTILIEDELTSRYYRIGRAEYTFLSLLDGKTTFATALGKTAAIMKQEALTEERAAGFCQWLITSGLASTPQSRSVERLTAASQVRENAKLSGMISGISQKFPLFHPDALVTLLCGMFGWMFSGTALLVWAGLASVGATTLYFHADEFALGTSEVISRSNWMWGLFTWLGLKLIHETAHAVACKRFGGTVREAGVLFILCVPLPYVDLTSSWRFGSKWQRILTSAAGMMAEIAIASIAVLIWSQTEPGLLHQHAYNVIIVAGISTLLFNLNPLMRFDGYYMLSDFLELPNLSGHGQQAIRHYARKFGLGLKETTPTWPEGRSLTFIVYGGAAFLWRILVCIGLIFGAGVLFSGAGTILAAVCVLLWLVLPVFKLLKFVAFGTKSVQPSRLRFAGVVTSGFALFYLMTSCIPWIGREEAPAVVEYYPRIELRTGVSGFVDEWNVRNGQVVKAGDVIARLRNHELLSQREEIDFQIAIAEQRATTFLQNQEMAAYQIEQESLVALRARQQDLQEQVDRLVIRVDAAGVLLTDAVDDLTGQFLHAGDLLAMVGATHDKELIALVDQTKYASFAKQVGQPIRMHVAGLGARWSNAVVSEVNPRATRQIPHPALVALNGGPIDVRAASKDEGNTSDKQASYELLEPHFIARITLPESYAETLKRGQTATIAIPSEDTNLGSHVARKVSNWWNRKTAFVQQQLYR